MSSTAAGSRVQVLAILQRDSVMDTVRRLLAEEGLAVTTRDAADRGEAWKGGRTAEAVIVDESLEPAEVAEAIDRGWIPGSVPLFVLARRLPDRDRYAAWLESGAWDIVKIPLESVALALRLQNILSGQAAERGGTRGDRYNLESLAQAADEALALARRYERPLHCVGLAVEWQDVDEDDVHPLMERIADATQRLTRRSDLLGLGDGRTLLILLPDTDAGGADIFVRRLEETLQGRLQEWGAAASLRTDVVGPGEAHSGGELVGDLASRLRTPAP